MGCDIHCYVEYRKEGRDSWESFGHRINPERNYSIFGKLAGVRGGDAIVPVRGIPDDLGFWANDDYWLFITETGEGDDYCTRQEADRWHAQGRRLRKSDHTGEVCWVEHPDWHTPSWVTPDEWAKCIAGEQGEIEYTALLAAMRHIEANGYKVRTVFWFDN